MALAEASLAYWDEHQVADFPEDVTAEQSLAAMNRRNEMYPGLLELMPINLPGLEILDFGCGPGHDTIGFLLNGAKRVFAVDSSRKGLASLRARLRAHGLEERCTVLDAAGLAFVPKVDHVHAAGVIHHLAAPISVLGRLRTALKPKAEIRMMVYDADSQFVQEDCGGDLEFFQQKIDHGAPLARAWTKAEVQVMANQAGLTAYHLGNYRIPTETEGPGLSACYSLKPWS